MCLTGQEDVADATADEPARAGEGGNMGRKIFRLLVVACFVAGGMVTVAPSSGSSTSRPAPSGETETVSSLQTPNRCKKCRRVTRRAKRCKRQGNNSPRCKRAIRQARKCKRVLRKPACRRPSGGGGTTPTEGGQTVEGSVATANPFPQDPNSCYSGKHRRGAVLSDGGNQGTDGYHFDVAEGTNGQNFVLEVTGGEGDVDLDITFYTEFGTVEQQSDTAYAPPNQSYESRGPGGEKGTVPEGMKKAIVCMLTGANATFTYKAGVETPR